MEPLGGKLRRQRRRLGLTLDDLAAKTGISKPYLSLIETGRVNNPPSDEKLRKLEQTLGFGVGELVSQAHLQRTPKDVRVMLQKLMAEGADNKARAQAHAAQVNGAQMHGTQTHGAQAHGSAAGLNGNSKNGSTTALRNVIPSGNNLDDAYLSGALQELVDKSAANVEAVSTNSVPVINRVSAGYPRDFTDLAYPRGVADDYVGCPDVHDKDAFAARVHGDSMSPKYSQGDIVIFSPVMPLRDGDDCFVRFEDGHTTFKRVFFEKDDSGTQMLRLQPRNEKYRPQTIPAEKITGLYRAVFRYQRVDEG